MWIGIGESGSGPGITSDTPSLPSTDGSLSCSHRVALGIEPREALGVGVPRPEGSASAVTAGVDKNDVTLFDGHAGGVELLRGDGVAGFEPVDAAEPWDVEQQPPAHDSVLGDLD
jgi:hypothetical protein